MYKINIPTQKIYVQHVSIDVLTESGWEMGDNGFQAENSESAVQNLWILDRLTKRQRQVVTLLADGYKRREIAQELQVSLQSVHQIVLRIRERVKKYESR